MNLIFPVEMLIRSFQFGAVNEILSMIAGSKGRNVFRRLFNRRGIARRSNKGISLIEFMLAISVLSIVVLGTAYFSFHTSGQVGLGKLHRAALQLASQKMEQLRADNDIGVAISDGETSEEVSSGDLSYTRTTVIEDNGSNKEVTVTVSWTQMGKERSVSLVSLLVEQ